LPSPQRARKPKQNSFDRHGWRALIRVVASTRRWQPNWRQRRARFLRSCLHQPGDHLSTIDHAGLLQDDSSVLHHDEIRNTHHVEALRQLRRSFRIHLQYDRAAGHLCRSALNFRCGRSARPAPCSPEIDQDWNASVGDNVVEGIAVDVDGFGNWRQGEFTRATSPRVGEVAARYPVLLSAAGAGTNHSCILKAP
jgi:hypothetical protein